jgi:hypothetical protein
MMAFRGQASWAKMTSPGDMVTALSFFPTKKVNKEEPISLQTLVMVIKMSSELQTK